MALKDNGKGNHSNRYDCMVNLAWEKVTRCHISTSSQAVAKIWAIWWSSWKEQDWRFAVKKDWGRFMSEFLEMGSVCGSIKCPVWIFTKYLTTKWTRWHLSILPHWPHWVNELLKSGPSYEECAYLKKILIASLQG